MIAYSGCELSLKILSLSLESSTEVLEVERKRISAGTGNDLREHGILILHDPTLEVVHATLPDTPIEMRETFQK